MKGLVYKDMLAVIRHFRSYFLIVLVFIGVSWFDRENLFYSLYPCILSGSVVVSLISLDETSKWNMTCGFLPFTQAQLVCAKYLVELILTAVFFGVSLGSRFIMMMLDGVVMWQELEILGRMLICCGLLMPGIMLPFVFRFGAEKGRLSYLIVLGVTTGLLAYFGDEGAFGEILGGISVGAALIGVLALYGVSCLISIGICERRVK